MFKVDIHVHTWYSKDALCKPKEIVKYAKKRGLDGIAITDHNTTKGWKETKKEAKKYNLFFIPGEEVKVFLHQVFLGELLCLFLQEEIKPGNVFEIIDKVKEQDGVVVLSHPFDFGRGFKKPELIAKEIQGVEVLNGKNFFKKSVKKADRFAEKYNLSKLGGSDAHICREVGKTFTFADVSGLEEFKKAVLKGKIGFFGKTNPVYRSLGPLVKIYRLLRFPDFF